MRVNQQRGDSATGSRSTPEPTKRSTVDRTRAPAATVSVEPGMADGRRLHQAAQKHGVWSLSKGGSWPTHTTCTNSQRRMRAQTDTQRLRRPGSEGTRCAVSFEHAGRRGTAGSQQTRSESGNASEKARKCSPSEKLTAVRTRFAGKTISTNKIKFKTYPQMNLRLIPMQNQNRAHQASAQKCKNVRLLELLAFRPYLRHLRHTQEF